MAQTVTINEIRIEQPGLESDEYVELKGPAGTSLDGYFYVVIGNDDFAFPPGQNGYVEEVISLQGQTIPAGGLFVIAHPGFTLGTANLSVPFIFEGDNNKSHLLVKGFTGQVGDDLDADDNGVLDSTPWTSVEDGVALVVDATPDGLSADYFYGTTTTVGPDAGVVPSQVWRCSDSGEWRIGLYDLSGGTDSPGEENPACGGSGAPVLISEIRIDEPGTDVNEYFELSGTPGTDLTGYTYLVIGDGTASLKSGVIENITSLAGQAIQANGLFLCAKNATLLGGTVTPNLVASGLTFENSDNVTHVLVKGFTGTAGQDLDTNDDGVLDVTPWTELVDMVALVEGTQPPFAAGDEYWYGSTVVGPDGLFGPGHIYRCRPNGDWVIGNFDPAALDAADTPGQANDDCEACGNIGGGNCFQAHATPGCQDASCCTQVCAVDPTCCNSDWDANCASLAMSLCLVAGSPPALQISEVRLDQPGADTQEFIEISGNPGTSLNGVSYVVIGSSQTDPAGVVDNVTPLGGVTIPPSGYLVIAKSTFTLGTANLVVPASQLNLATNAAKTHLLVWNNMTLRGEDLDAGNDCTLDYQGWQAVIDEVGLKSAVPTECLYTTTTVEPVGEFVASLIYRCTPTGDWKTGSFSSFDYDTPGAANVSCDAVGIFACGEAEAGDCFTPHANAHCSNQTCCEAVCEVLPACCEVAWDADCVTAAGLLTACGGGAAPVRINEVRIDQPSTDVDEYVELKAAPGTSLDGYVYVIIGDGVTPPGGDPPGSGVIETVVDLTGQTVGSSGYFVIGEATLGLGTPDLVLKDLNLENSDNTTHMLVTGFTGALGDDLDTDNDGVLDATPWASVVDAISPVLNSGSTPGSNDEWWYAARIGPDGGSPPAHIYRCETTGYWFMGDFDPSASVDSVGAANPACPSGPCPADLNGDGQVNGADLGLLIGNWGGTGVGDINNDGGVNGADLGLLIGNWGACL